MQNSQLFLTCRKLEKAELDAIAEMAGCSMFNKKKEVLRLADYISRYINRREGRFFSKEAVFRAVFPNTQFDDGKLRLVFSHTLKLVERYFAIQEMESRESEKELYLLRALQNRGLDKRYDKKLDALRNNLEASHLRDAKWNQVYYELVNEELRLVASRRRSVKVELHPLHDHLTSYYLSEMLRQACTALTHQAISTQVYDMDLLQQVLRLAEAFGLEGKPAVEIYYHACRSMMAPDEPEHFEQWKSCLHTSIPFFSANELRGVYLLGINYCIRRMNSGKPEFIREAFELYKKALENQLLAENGYLTAFTFKNVIRIGSALGEKKWTAKFFDEYQNQIHPKERANVVKYNKAFLHFYQGQYDEAMPLLLQVDFKDKLNNLDSRRMLLRIYFELKEWKALDSHMHSFETYLRRQKDLGYHRKMYLNLIKFIQQYLELTPRDKEAANKLKTRILETSPVAEKDWLLERFDWSA